MKRVEGKELGYIIIPLFSGGFPNFYSQSFNTIKQTETVNRTELMAVWKTNRRSGEGNVALHAAPNPFLCTLYLNKICLNQIVV